MLTKKLITIPLYVFRFFQILKHYQPLTPVNLNLKKDA